MTVKKRIEPDDLVDRLIKARDQLLREYRFDSGIAGGCIGLLHEAVERIFTLQEDVSAGEELANAVGPLVEESMERNGPQVRSDIVEAYRELRARQEAHIKTDGQVASE